MSDDREVFSVEDRHGDKLRVMEWDGGSIGESTDVIGSVDWSREDDDSDANSVHLTLDQASGLGEKLVEWTASRRAGKPPRPRVIHIVGSSRFKQFHLGFAQKFTLQGKIVLLAGFFHHADNFPITDDQKREIDDLCLRKVDLADELFVVNPNSYIGESTRRAIVYAKELGKPVEFMDPPLDEDWRNVG